MTIHEDYIGCDVSKDHLDLFDPKSSRHWQIDNRAKAIHTALQKFKHRSVFFVFEATGSYDQALRYALASLQIPSVRLNPLAVKRFREALGKRAKTDLLDACLLSRFGQALAPQADPDISPQLEEICAFNQLRDQLVEARSKEKTRLKEACYPDIVSLHEEMIALLNDKIKAVEKKIEALVRADDQLKKTSDLLQTAPGVGPVAATTLISLLPELGTVNEKTIASLVGLAPFNHDSGKLKGKRAISGGRNRVRKALYMATLSIVQRKSRYQDLYQQFLERGKAKKVALVAVMRKMLTHLNAMIRDQKEWA